MTKTIFRSDELIALSAIVSIPIIEGIYYYIGYITGNKLGIDVYNYWRPFAHSVVADGTIPYLAVSDNKPPVFQIINIFSYLTGHYELVFIGIIAIGNAAAAMGTYYLGKKWLNSQRIGLIAALLLVATIPIFTVEQINARTIAVACGIWGLLFASDGRALLAGIIAGVGALYSHYAGIYLIAGLIIIMITSEDVPREASKYIGASAGMAILTYGGFGIIYGPEGLIAAISNTMPVIGSYVSNSTGVSIWANPSVWFRNILIHGSQVFFILIPATFSILMIFSDSNKTPEWMWVLFLTASTGGPLLVRAYQEYWFYSMPFICLLSSLFYMYSWSFPGNSN